MYISVEPSCIAGYDEHVFIFYRCINKKLFTHNIEQFRHLILSIMPVNIANPSELEVLKQHITEQNAKIPELRKKVAEIEAENVKLRQIIKENSRRDTKVRELERYNTELETRV